MEVPETGLEDRGVGSPGTKTVAIFNSRLVAGDGVVDRVHVRYDGLDLGQRPGSIK